MSATLNVDMPRAVQPASWIGGAAVDALLLELTTFPKPGLVSPVDCGSHADMDAAVFRASAEALRPFFDALAAAGAADAGMGELRAIGRDAERSMLAATGGVNTHRGAIFGLGLLCAAAGALGRCSSLPASGGRATTPGAFVRRRWGSEILCGPPPR